MIINLYHIYNDLIRECVYSNAWLSYSIAVIVLYIDLFSIDLHEYKVVLVNFVFLWFVYIIPKDE